jgi:3-hydroxyacyl-[acyl-carrier-protein] dehydratase
MSAHALSLRFASDHPALAGHFPEHPIVPGVLLLDAAIHGSAQVSQAWHIVMVKFHRPVRPDENLHLDYRREAGELLHFELRAGEDLAVSGTFGPATAARRHP